jgi:hypothetical protein
MIHRRADFHSARHRGDCADAGHRAHGLGELAGEGHRPFVLERATPRKHDLHPQRSLGAEAGIDREDAAEALPHQPCRAEEHHCQRHLQHHQAVAERMAVDPASGGGAFF